VARATLRARSEQRLVDMQGKPKTLDVKTYMCLICGFIYDEAKGRPEEGIPPGTKWADIPLSWRCPDCGSGKEDFEMIEVS
jgi:rubredoxin